ncbi:hypothetical protein C8A01DRAFT_33847 [Parachaetomium inaequale]|uniref:Acylphosphatase-like domain-containing protein n=1 Tax=Parachaetomium inaequale TaxID=2588326 RepID=A0AAN6PJD7_9PEZI|nr:hypothetical protein C8A01DRAFT_33847 [Parachaetomium inaequale]
MVKRVYFLAHGGLVQGVNFRQVARPRLDMTLKHTTVDTNVVTCIMSIIHFTRHQAVEHKLTGWVEGEAQGEEDAIAAFLKHVDKGPRHAQVVRLDKEDREVVEGEAEFEIRR